MTPRKALPWLLLAAAVAFLAWKLRSAHFDWAGFLHSLRSANPFLLLAATLVIYAQNILRAARWAIFLHPAYRSARRPPIAWWRLIGSQFIGFTGLAIFGRIGELIRPALVAQRTGLSFSSQIAVVTVERVFDLAAFACIFSLNLLLSPSLQTLPFHERFHQVGYAVATLTLIIAAFVVTVRVAGNRAAAFAQRLLKPLSTSFASTAHKKLLEFRDGLNVIDGLPAFLQIAALSLLLWSTIAFAYVLVMRAFPAPVSQLTIADVIVLLGFSIVGSLVQLPGVGGGAQVSTISALTLLFSIPAGLAVSAGVILWLITTMAIIPAGLLYARVEGISLKQLARRSEQAEEHPSSV